MNVVFYCEKSALLWGPLLTENSNWFLQLSLHASMQETWIWILGLRRSPGGGNTHSSILAWRIPWTRSLAVYREVAKSWTWLIEHAREKNYSRSGTTADSECSHSKSMCVETFVACIGREVSPFIMRTEKSSLTFECAPRTRTSDDIWDCAALKIIWAPQSHIPRWR